MFCLQSVLHIHSLTGERLTTLPLDIGSVVGYSGRKKDSEVRIVCTNVVYTVAFQVLYMKFDLALDMSFTTMFASIIKPKGRSGGQRG